MSNRSGAVWFKSSRSAQQDACVEVAHFSERTGVRDSKHSGGPELMFPVGVWEDFTNAVKAGRFDLP